MSDPFNSSPFFNLQQVIAMKILMLITVIILMFGCATQEKQNRGVANIEIDGDKWVAVKRFDNSSAKDKHYIVSREVDGSTVIIFGDGKQGARLPTGTSSIKMSYRQGGGKRYTGVRQQEGRVEASDCK